MEKIASIHLNGKATQLEESGYDALRAYLSQAEEALANNPDKAEIIADLEQAISEKCAACLTPNKDVVKAEEIERIIREMGPVQGTDAKGTPDRAAPSSSGAAKRLYLISEGAWIGGVCTGLAAYFNVDVVLVRAIFVALTFVTGGGFILVYLALMFLLPYAATTEERAAAQGLPFNAQEIVNRAKETAERVANKTHWDRHRMRAEFRQKRWEARRAWREQRRAIRAARYHGAPFLGLISVILAIVWISALISLIAHGTVFGLAVPASMPIWVAIILLFLAYHAVTGPLRAVRWHAYAGDMYGCHAYGAWHAIADAMSTAFVLIAIFFAYTHIPPFHDFVNNIPANVQSWFASVKN